MSAHRVFVGTVVAYALLLAYASAALPQEDVPLHFGLSGDPDRFGGRTEAVVTLTLVGLGTAALLGVIAWAVGAGRMPWQWVNIPHKDYWQAPEREARARSMLSEDLGWVGAMTMGLLCVVVLAVLAAATTGGSLGAWFWVGLVAYLLGITVFTVRMHTHRYRPPQEG